MEPVTLHHPTGDRRYLLARPPGRGPFPLVVFLHGTGGTAAWADGETGLSAFGVEHGFAVATPDGLPVDPSRPAKFLTNPPRWNDGSTRPGDLLHTDADDVTFLADVIRDSIVRAPADPHRVAVTGFSNGAGMAFHLAAERAELLAAVVPVAGHCWVEQPRPVRPVPTLYIVGAADPLIPLRGGQVRSPWGGRLVRRPAVAETLQRWATAIGCDPVPRVVANVDGVRDEMFSGPVEFRAIEVNGLGHHWPGGRGQLNPRLGGAPSDRVRANQIVWDFLRRHRIE